MADEIKLQPVGQMQPAQPAPEQKEMLPSYSERYYDDFFEYRHVSLTLDQAQRLPKPMRLLNEIEWRSLGVQQSKGWYHYAVHRPEPHVLLFRRAKYFGTEKEVTVPEHLNHIGNAGGSQNQPAN